MRRMNAINWKSLLPMLTVSNQTRDLGRISVDGCSGKVNRGICEVGAIEKVWRVLSTQAGEMATRKWTGTYAARHSLDQSVQRNPELRANGRKRMLVCGPPPSHDRRFPE